MRRTYRLLALFAIVALPASAQQRDFSAVEIKAAKVAGTVYILTGVGGNIGVSVGDDGIVIVDDQFAPLAPKIKEALKAITDKPIKFILNTHYHGDHTGGNEFFGREAPIIAHDNVRKRLASGTSRSPAAPRGALPVVTFNHTATIHVNGEEIRAVHFPSGHTDGDAVIYFPQSNVIHMGDHFFNANFPFIDVDSGGTVKGFIANVERVVATAPDDVKVIPGHGALADKAALRRFLEMLKATSAAVQTAIREGKTVEQMKSEKILAAWESWASSFITADRFIDVLHREATGR
jgi:cyclase